MKRVLHYVYPFRFQLYFISLLMMMFGSLFMPLDLFEDYFMFIFIILNLLAGTTLFLYAKRLVYSVTVLMMLFVIVAFVNQIIGTQFVNYKYVRFFIYAVYYSFIAGELVKQVWQAKTVSANIILGMMSGYISLGFVAYFGFLGIEILAPGSYNGIPADMLLGEKSRELMNFSYITLLTVGYGDISPDSYVAQKLAVLTAMMGQFYLVIITAVVIGKFLQHKEGK